MSMWSLVGGFIAGYAVGTAIAASTHIYRTCPHAREGDIDPKFCGPWCIIHTKCLQARLERDRLQYSDQLNRYKKRIIELSGKQATTFDLLIGDEFFEKEHGIGPKN